MKPDWQWQPGCEMTSHTLALHLSDRQYLPIRNRNSLPATAISQWLTRPTEEYICNLWPTVRTPGMDASALGVSRLCSSEVKHRGAEGRVDLGSGPSSKAGPTPLYFCDWQHGSTFGRMPMKVHRAHVHRAYCVQTYFRGFASMASHNPHLTDDETAKHFPRDTRIHTD